MPLPPGPRRPAAVQLAQWSFRPLPFMEECARRFGDLFTLRMPGFGAMVFVHAPGLIKEVFTGDPELLHAGEVAELFRRIVGPSSVLLLNGQPHLRQRRLLLPPLRGERMHAYATLMRELTLASVATWPVGQPFELHPRMRQLTLDVILRAVFGLEEGARMSDLSSLILAFTEPPPDFLVFLHAELLEKLDFPASPYRTFLERRARVDREIYRLIAERREAPDLDARTDILSMLLLTRDEDGLPMTDVELRDELVTLLVGAHETTAISVSWAFEQVLREPAVVERVRCELREVLGSGPFTPEAVTRLEYLDAVVKEVLRLRPTVPAVMRRTRAPYKLAGYDLPIGTGIVACGYLAHRRPDIYPDPDRFFPDRFLGAKIDPYAWLPFGGGMRRCLGMAFALYEIKIILATTLGCARLERATQSPERMVRRSIALAPSKGARVILTSQPGRG